MSILYIIPVEKLGTLHPEKTYWRVAPVLTISVQAGAGNPEKSKLVLETGEVIIDIPEKVNTRESAEKFLATRKVVERVDPSHNQSCRLRIFPFPALATRSVEPEKYRLVGLESPSVRPRI